MVRKQLKNICILRFRIPIGPKLEVMRSNLIDFNFDLFYMFRYNETYCGGTLPIDNPKFHGYAYKSQWHHWKPQK